MSRIEGRPMSTGPYYTFQQPETHPNVTFCPLTWDDMPEVERLNTELFPVSYSSQFYQRLFNDNVFNVLARSTHDNSLVGLACARILESDSCFGGERVAYLMTLGVTQDLRRQNLGTALLKEVCRLASEFGRCTAMRLHVQCTNQAAVSFYRRHHFELQERISDYYFFHDSHHDAYVFELALSPGGDTDSNTVAVARPGYLAIFRRPFQAANRILHAVCTGAVDTFTV